MRNGTLNNVTKYLHECQDYSEGKTLLIYEVQIEQEKLYKAIIATEEFLVF